jgi:hypothetical protein
MPGFILHEGAVVLCAHGGQAEPTSPNPRVLVMGMPVTMVPIPYAVAGCPWNIIGVPMPCVTAMWIMGSIRVTSMGLPLLLMDSQAICIPNGTPTVIVEAQTRVFAM